MRIIAINYCIHEHHSNETINKCLMSTDKSLSLMNFLVNHATNDFIVLMWSMIFYAMIFTTKHNIMIQILIWSRQYQ